MEQRNSIWKPLRSSMSFHQQHPRKDNSHEEVSVGRLVVALVRLTGVDDIKLWFSRLARRIDNHLVRACVGRIRRFRRKGIFHLDMTKRRYASVCK